MTYRLSIHTVEEVSSIVKENAGSWQSFLCLSSCRSNWGEMCGKGFSWKVTSKAEIAFSLLCILRVRPWATNVLSDFNKLKPPHHHHLQTHSKSRWIYTAQNFRGLISKRKRHWGCCSYNGVQRTEGRRPTPLTHSPHTQLPETEISISHTQNLCC